MDIFVKDVQITNGKNMAILNLIKFNVFRMQPSWNPHFFL